MTPKMYYVQKVGLGYLAVMAKPMCGALVEEEFSGLAELGVMQIVSLLETAEQDETGLANEKELCEKNNIKFISYPIKDHYLPASVTEFSQVTKTIYNEITEGMNTVIHCRAGIGRTGMVAAGVLLHATVEAIDAFQILSRARGVQMPETEQQYNWVVANQTEIMGGESQSEKSPESA